MMYTLMKISPPTRLNGAFDGAQVEEAARQYKAPSMKFISEVLVSFSKANKIYT